MLVLISFSFPKKTRHSCFLGKVNTDAERGERGCRRETGLSFNDLTEYCSSHFKGNGKVYW